MNFKAIILSIFPIISYGMTQPTSASITHACLIDFQDEEKIAKARKRMARPR